MQRATTNDFEPHSVPYVVYGTIILWVSWLFFNGGSSFSMFGDRETGIAKIVMNTIISGTAGGLSAAIIKPLITGSFKKSFFDVSGLANGLLAGLVSITGACDGVEPWMALIIGVIGGAIYALACKLSSVLNVDDPIEASAVHGFGGIWGLIAVGIFHAPTDDHNRWSFLGV